VPLVACSPHRVFVVVLGVGVSISQARSREGSVAGGYKSCLSRNRTEQNRAAVDAALSAIVECQWNRPDADG